MRFHIRSAAALGALALATAATLGAAQARTIKVGIIAPYTGGFATWGIQFRNCINLFMKEHGDTVAGNKVEIIYRDTGGANPSLAKKHAEELFVKEKVDILGGFYFTPNALAVAPVLNKAKKPGVIFLAATPFITDKSKYYVRTGYSMWQSAVPMAEWAYKNGVRKVYIAVSDFAPGHSVQAAFKKTFTELGGTIVGEDRMAMSTPDYAPFVQRIQDAKPDAVYIFLPVGPPSIGFLKAFAARGLHDKGIKVMGVAETADLELPALGPKAAKDVMSAFYYTLSYPSDMNKKFVKDLVAANGEKGIPNAGCVGAYDGMKVIYAMIEKTGGKLGPKAVDAVKGMTFESPRGPIMIDAKTRDIVQNIYIRKVVEKDGKLYNEIVDTFKQVKDPWKELKAAGKL